MGALAATKISVKEYLALDRVAEVRSEYHDGEMFPLEAATLQHSIISANVSRLLGDRLLNTPCGPMLTLRVRVSPTKYVIPGMLVICGKPMLTDERNETVTNPKFIVEILSPSTENYDYGTKFILYRELESFEEYMLVSQDKARVEVMLKTPDKRWLITTYEGLDATVVLESLNISLPMSEIYRRVELPALN